MTEQRSSDLLDVKGASGYLGVPESFVRRVVLEKRVRYYKLGKYLRFRPADLDALVERGRVEPVEDRALPRRQISNTHLFTGPRRRTTRSGETSGAPLAGSSQGQRLRSGATTVGGDRPAEPR